MKKKCQCGRGHCSAFDHKCAHCRTRRERIAYERRFDPDPEARRYGFRNEQLN